MPESGEYWSHNKTCVVLALAFAALTWSVAAASYAKKNEQPGSPGIRPVAIGTPRMTLYYYVGRMAAEGIAQIPHAHHVIGYVISEQPWMIGLLMGLETIPIGSWFLLRRVERQLESSRWRRR